MFDLLTERQKPMIALCMGEFGEMSRVLAPKFGGFLTFAASDPSGGAGLQADILTLASMGCHPLSVVTALTADPAGVPWVVAEPGGLMRLEGDRFATVRLAGTPPAASAGPSVVPRRARRRRRKASRQRLWE